MSFLKIRFFQVSMTDAYPVTHEHSCSLHGTPFFTLRNYVCTKTSIPDDSPPTFQEMNMLYTKNKSV
jgi:hypothetical protein